jgi:hypothetical protein
VKPDWNRLRGVILESDDWGLCAWSPDADAHRALAGTPAFRGPAGRVFGRSTLETAADVRSLTDLLLEFRGADGRPPVWQANMVVAAPDYERLAREGFAPDDLPVVLLPDMPSRWQRPGLWEQVAASIQAGVWWPELHGLHHLPAQTWLAALRRGDADARLAFAEQCPVCVAVEASAEFDPIEPAATRARDIQRAVARFAELFGRPPGSFCPPDYRWDASLEEDVERLGIPVLQGAAERAGPGPRLRRLLHLVRWPDERHGHLLMPPRIAFEPRGDASPNTRLGAAQAHARAQAAWHVGRPAVVSTHRLNYVHLDDDWSEAGRAALRDLLSRLCGDGAVFLTDVRVRDLVRPGVAGRDGAAPGA